MATKRNYKDDCLCFHYGLFLITSTTTYRPDAIFIIMYVELHFVPVNNGLFVFLIFEIQPLCASVDNERKAGRQRRSFSALFCPPAPKVLCSRSAIVAATYEFIEILFSPKFHYAAVCIYFYLRPVT